MKKFLPILTLVLFFLFFKLSNLGIRLSDSNIYFYTGYEILQGKILYKDLFFTNFPFIPYLSSLYFLIIGGNLKLFFLTPVIEVSLVSFFIYKIVFEKYKKIFIATISASLYLFSFIILSTSDHQSGVFFASLAAVLAYYFYQKEKYFLSGISIAITLLTKAYFIPVALSLGFLFLIDKKWKNLIRFLLGGSSAGIIIMLPTFFFAFPDFIDQVFKYSLTRSQGVDKLAIIWFFIRHDFSLFILLIINIFLIKKEKFFGLLSFFGIIFFIVYKDIYYLYLNFLIPFLCISYAGFHKAIQVKFDIQKGIIPTVLLLFIFYNFISYTDGFRNLQKINNINQITNKIKQEKPNALYGTNDITTALAYLSNTPLLNNVIDTNSNIYRQRILDAKKMTTDAISQKSIIVAHGAYYPLAGIEEVVIDEIFDKEQIIKNCKLIESYPVQMEGIENRLNLFRCY